MSYMEDMKEKLQRVGKKVLPFIIALSPFAGHAQQNAACDDVQKTKTELLADMEKEESDNTVNMLVEAYNSDPDKFNIKKYARFWILHKIQMNITLK